MRNETCAECGRVLLEEEATEFEGRVYCPECLDSLTTFCRYWVERYPALLWVLRELLHPLRPLR